MYRFLFVLFLVGITACPNTKKEGKQLQKDINNELVIGIENAPANLDPRFATDAYAIRIGKLIFPGLVTLDENFKPKPLIAEKIETLNDTTYMITLKKGVRFHDGQELTASDVEYTFKSIMDPELKSPHASGFQKINKIEVLDPYTLKITLNEPFAPFEEQILVFGIIPKHVAENLKDKFNTNPIGAGAFKFEKQLDGGDVYLVKNTNYFETPPHIDRLIFKVIPDVTVRMLELLKGSIDLTQNALPQTLLERFKNSDKVNVMYSPSASLTYIGFNLNDPMLKNSKVRKAIAYAINREDIIKYKFEGHATLARGALGPINWAYEPNVSTYEHNVEKAKKLLDEAGYKDPDGDGPKARFELVFKTSTEKERIDIAKIYIDNLKNVGIQLSLRTHEWGVFFTDIQEGNFHLFSLKWPFVAYPDFLYYIFHTKSFPPNGANRGRYTNAEVDKLLDQSRKELDRGKQKEIFSKLQNILADELPYIFLWHEENNAVVNKRVKNYTLSASGDFQSLINSSISE